MLDSAMALWLTREHCVDLMPEWSDFDLKIDALTGGITNKLFRIQISNGEEYVIRVYGEKTDLFIDRHVEMENILLMEPSGVTPRLIKYIPERNVTIVEFIAGTPFKNEDFLAEDLIEKIVRPIQLIHNSGVKLSRLFDPLEETRKLYKILKGVGPEYTEFDILGTLDILGKISAISRIRPSSYLPCHNDLLADNFIMVEKQNRYREPVYLIDWEYAGMNTPYYEISDMFQEIIVPKQIEDKILRAYWEDSNMDEHFLKTDMFRPFPDIYWFLWSLIQQNISRIKFDFYNYGRVKYENAQKSIQFLREHYALSI